MEQGYFDPLFRTISDGALIVSSQGRLIRINPAAAMMLRLDSEASLNKTPTEALREFPALLALIQNGAERLITLPDQRMARGLCEVLPDGAILILLRDVTEREALDSRRELLIH